MAVDYAAVRQALANLTVATDEAEAADKAVVDAQAVQTEKQTQFETAYNNLNEAINTPPIM